MYLYTFEADMLEHLKRNDMCSKTAFAPTDDFEIKFSIRFAC